MTIQQTIEIPANRRVFFDLPKTVPTGVTNAILTLFVEKTAEHGHEPDKPRCQPTAFPTIDELRAEARRKHAERFKDGHDAMQRFRGCLKDIFPEDGVVYQRRWHEEWDREWDT